MAKTTQRWGGYKKQDAKELKQLIENVQPIIAPNKEQLEEVASNVKAIENAVPRTNRPPFTGCTEVESDKIRMIVSMKYQGYSMSEAFNSVGLPVSTGHELIGNRRDGYAEAEKEHLEVCLRSYQTNLWIVRTALSELGPRAIKVLATIMDDKKVSANIRAKVAITLLKMMDVDHSASGGSQETMAKEFMGFLKEVRQSVKSDTIVDAEEAEVIEYGSGGDDD